MRWRSSDEMLGVEIPRCRGTTDTEVQDTATAVGSSAGDAMHRATPPYGWRVLLVVVGVTHPT